MRSLNSQEIGDILESCSETRTRTSEKAEEDNDVLSKKVPGSPCKRWLTESASSSHNNSGIAPTTSAISTRNMIPESNCTPSANLEKLNHRNNTPPVAPPLPPLDPQGLILPRKPQNPCLESAEHKNLHRELLFNQKVGKNVLNQKSELQRALEKHKEHQMKKEVEQQKQESKSALERVIEERAKRLETMEKLEEEEKSMTGETEFMKIHAKLRSKMDLK